MNHKKYAVDKMEYINTDKLQQEKSIMKTNGIEYIINEYELYFNYNMKICRHCEGAGIREFIHSTDECNTCHGTGIYSISQ